MTDPSKSAVVTEHEDARTDGPMTGDERVVLDHWLDLYRETVLLKIAGLDADQLARRAGYVVVVSPRRMMARELAAMAPAIQSGTVVHT